MERRSPVFTVFIYACALLLAAIILAPIAWLFIMSISPAADLAAKPLRWWPQAADFSRYQTLLSTAENSAGAAFTVALLHDGELIEYVPAEEHDQPVRAAITPSGGVTLNASSDWTK